jgi:hypothetical protein
VGLLWLYNVSWKRAPDFGQDSGKGLFGFTQDAVDHPVFPPFSWLVEHLVLPNFAVFGWSVLVIESALAVLLLTGTYVRLAALVGIAQSLAIGLSVAQTPGEWPWSYWLMISVHVALLFGTSGSVFAVDAVRAEGIRADSASHPAWRSLALGWGGVISVAAIVALLMSIGDSPFTSSGARLGGPGLSIGLGSYNLAGSILLLVCGVSLLTAVLTRRHALAIGAAGAGAVAAVVVYAQSASSASILGGTNTSAAFFVCIAVIGAAVWSAGQPNSTPWASGSSVE